MEFQTRNDADDIRIFTKFNDAYNASLEDKTIWKITITIEGEIFRWVKKLPGDVWGINQENRLKFLSNKYLHDGDNMVFWIHQKLIPDNYDETMEREDITDDEKALLNLVNCLVEVLTDKEFIERYKIY